MFINQLNLHGQGRILNASTPSHAAGGDRSHISRLAGVQDGDRTSLTPKGKRDGAAQGGDVAIPREE